MAQGLALATLPLGSAVAQPASMTACDILTAHPDDASRVAEPVPFNERDAARAIPACEEALRQHPNQPRLRYQLGLAYDSARRYVESLSSYQQAANADYTAAGFALGWAYANGEGTPRDDAAAIRWYQWAAERGHSAAQNTLGFMYENGRGVTASLSQAADWYRRAHEQGRPIASANYGRMLALGFGGPVGTTPALRRTLAATVLRQAVLQDRPDAALRLALIAERGEVQIDRSQLIQLWAFAEARSPERERARRSLERLAAQGSGAEIEQARAAVAQRQRVLDTERNGAREAREAALRRLAMAPAQSAPIQPNVRGATQASVAAPAPAVPSASAVPSSASTRTADPSSDQNQWSRVANTARAWIEPWTRDPLAMAGSAAGLTLSLGVFGFWLGRRRGQQALRAAKVMQRSQPAFTSSIAEVYLAPQQASFAATATSQSPTAGAQAPTAQAIPTIALDKTSEVKRSEPIQKDVAAFEAPTTASAKEASTQPTAQSETEHNTLREAPPSKTENEMDAQQVPNKHGAFEIQNIPDKTRPENLQADDSLSIEHLVTHYRANFDRNNFLKDPAVPDNDKNISGGGASAATAEFSSYASEGRIPLRDLIISVKEGTPELDMTVFGSVDDFIENVEWCNAYRKFRYEISQDAEIDIAQAKTLASIPNLSRNANCKIRLVADAESLQRIWKERKFIYSYNISGHNKVSYHVALLICSFGQVELQANATFLVYGKFHELLHCRRDKNVAPIATAYELTGYNSVSPPDYANLIKLPNFRLAAGAILEQKNAHSTIFRTFGERKSVVLLVMCGAAVTIVFYTQTSIFESDPNKESTRFLETTISSRCQNINATYSENKIQTLQRIIAQYGARIDAYDIKYQNLRTEKEFEKKRMLVTRAVIECFRN